MTPAARVMRKHLVCLVALITVPCFAQSGPGGYPNKPVRVVVPAAAGSLTDPIARIVTEELARRTGQPWVIDNRPGAGGMIGAENAARSAPDGYTLLFSANALIITPSLYPATTRYKVAEDFTPISLAARADNLLVASAAAGIRNIQELVTTAKQTPGGLNYTSPLIGSAAHLTVELFRTTAGIPLNHVAYKDSSQGTTDTLSGRIAVNIMGIATAMPHIRAGKIVPLAWTGAKRAAELPDTPTFAEAGYPQVHLGLWFGYFGPAKMPADLVAYLNQQINAALKAPAVVEKLSGMRIESVGSTAQDLAALIAREQPVYAKVVADAKLNLD
ncbi:MAG: Bug family tripartite tricarboxylate transporter substrate binding protein [Burkholderiales bacterium]